MTFVLHAVIWDGRRSNQNEYCGVVEPLQPRVHLLAHGKEKMVAGGGDEAGSRCSTIRDHVPITARAASKQQRYKYRGANKVRPHVERLVVQ